ncbi:MAG: hypothetical protein BGP24_09205 [Lysobacterales bacterium 69-70]|nr:hypothetical protein [Xanthomonadaceae bacterium]ODU33140.1 MAG: hypothetical protein ABS97_12230 [Xanthomonadaceae bacterium SCN 69-320]ODV20532.1 MAG: hypothetical protein ABT27_07445 [Xanthomonadaceae bacterium SCN 69-25]OJZ00686.1 MAG: hypothetical protein BGP24_09205 [Xanthomonadales bacterium 69-70]
MDELITIGPRGLYGLLSEPPVPSTLPAVVLFNAGFVHKVGPFRLHVRLARALAAAGRLVLRLDLPGVGDAPNGDTPWLAAAGQALDAVQARTGTSRFVVGGLCSAADLGWRLALADPRVGGLILLDGLARRGAWFRLGQLQLFLCRPFSHWPGMLARRFGRSDPGDPAAEDLRDWPAPGSERADMAGLLVRGVEIYALYTGGAAPYFLHPRQFTATFGAAARAPQVRLEHWRDCDHAFYANSDRRRLIAALAQWMDQHCVA